MGYTQDKLNECYQIESQAKAPSDFEDFWDRQMGAMREIPLDACCEPYAFASPHAEVYDVSFGGCDGTRIHGWFLVPRFVECEKLPCVVHYHGFTGERGNPADYLAYLMMGCCVLAVDCRAQSGMTGDRHAYGTGLVENVCMQGILDPEDYYFKFLYLDAVRALDFACTRDMVDPGRLVVEGGSQGGGLSLAVAALDSRPFAVLCDVPSNCDIHKRIENGYGSFRAVRSFLQKYPQHTDQAFQTVAYFDLIHFARRITCPVFASAGLLDDVCPARYFFAAYNRIPGEKEVCLYPFNNHEGGGSTHFERKLAYLGRLFGGAR